MSAAGAISTPVPAVAPPSSVGAMTDTGDTAAILSGDDGGGSGDPTFADMEAIMRAEQVAEDDGRYEMSEPTTAKPGDIVPTKLSPPEKKADEPAAEPPSEAKPAEEPAKVEEKKDEETEEEPPAPAINAAEEARRLRKAAAKLAREREGVLAKVNEANAALERAKQYEAAAERLKSLPETVKRDPLKFLAEVGVDVDTLLQTIVETEKSPVEKRIEQLEREREAEKAQIAREREERAVREQQEQQQRTITAWREGNIAAIKAKPEEFDLILTLGQEEAVHENCLAYFNLHKVLPDPVVIAQHLEKHLRNSLGKSAYVKKFGQSAPVAAAAKPAAQSAQPSNATSAPKRSGPTTLAGVASGEAAPSERALPEDEDARLAATLREMAAANELPDAFRPR